ncbi:MAG: hypothetical protein U0L17_03435 [Acutalibacteraceae bacterium]|nr:hypothetical protein [Acutalibacteraceae bacterium]
MSINNDAFAERFTGELDKIITEKSSVGFMADNAFKAKFVGAKTVKIPSISLQGLGDYDRKTGFIKGAVNVSNTAYTMKQDRARTFVIDREDMDETGIASLAGNVMGEFVRTKVVPETDAYTISKLGSLAATRGQIVTDYDLSKPYDMFNKLLDSVQSEIGLDEELVCFMNRYVWNQLRKSNEISKLIDVSDFKQGEISLSVNKIDNVTIIPVSNSKMMTAFEFLSGKDGDEEGGYAPTPNSRGIFMLMLPKSAASLVKKSEKIRIFTPDQNLNADAYKFDYRLYYDVFVKKSYVSSVWAVLAPTITITQELPDSITVKAGSITESLTCISESDNDSATAYQWYKCSDENKTDPVRIPNETDSTYELDKNLTAGTYYYFVKTFAEGSTFAYSNVCKVIVK